METAILMNAASFRPLAVISLLAALSWIIGSVIYSRPIYEIRLATPVLLSLVFNTALLVWRIITDHYLIDDENSWHHQALIVTEAIRTNSEIQEGELSRGKEGYAWLVGALYTVAGPVPLVPIGLNILLFALLVPILAATTDVVAKELGLRQSQGQKAVKFAAYFIALTPSVVFWSPRLLREVISMFLISISVLCVLLFLRDRKVKHFTGAIITVVLMVTIRPEVGAALAAGLIMGVVIAGSLRFRGKIARTAVLLPTFSVLFLATWSFADSTGDLSVENTIGRNRALANASSAFSGAEEVQAADSIVEIALFNLPRVLLGPFPHEFNFSSVMLLATISNFFWLTAIVLASHLLTRRTSLEPISANHGTTQRTRWWAVLVVVTIFLTLAVMLSIIAGNYGLVVRMRLMPFVVLIPLAGLGYVMLTALKPTLSPSAEKIRGVRPTI